VTVNSSGLVTAVGNGSTYVVATTAGKKDSALVAVSQVIQTVQVSPPNPIIAVGNSAQLTATGKDANANDVVGASFSWSSSDDAKAIVNPSGVVTAFAGTATITATSTNNK